MSGRAHHQVNRAKHLPCSRCSVMPARRRGLCLSCIWAAERDGTLPTTWTRLNSLGALVTVRGDDLDIRLCSCGKRSKKGRCRGCYYKSRLGHIPAQRGEPAKVEKVMTAGETEEFLAAAVERECLPHWLRDEVTT